MKRNNEDSNDRNKSALKVLEATYCRSFILSLSFSFSLSLSLSLFLLFSEVLSLGSTFGREPFDDLRVGIRSGYVVSWRHNRNYNCHYIYRQHQKENTTLNDIIGYL